MIKYNRYITVRQKNTNKRIEIPDSNNPIEDTSIPAALREITKDLTDLEQNLGIPIISFRIEEA